MEDSHVKINFTHEIFISHMELKHFRKWNTVFTGEMACETFIRDYGLYVKTITYFLVKTYCMCWWVILFGQPFKPPIECAIGKYCSLTTWMNANAHLVRKRTKKTNINCITKVRVSTWIGRFTYQMHVNKVTQGILAVTSPQFIDY